MWFVLVKGQAQHASRYSCEDAQLIFYLWKAVRNASRDGLALVKFGIRTYKQDLISTGLCP